MGKKSREKVKGKGYLSNIKDRMVELAQEGATFEDNEGIIKIISPTKLEVTPKNKNISIEEFHINFIKRMDTKKYKSFYNLFNIYISEDRKKVILSK